MSRIIRRRVRRATAILLIVCLCTVGTMTAAAEVASASVMKLTELEGTVAVANKNGRSITIIKGMKLYNGYQIGTEAASYAYISLDAAKAVKLDAVSAAEIRQKGKQLEVLLVKGNLFFNVTEPLKADETLNIRTSTMVTGIRGTCGWIKKINETTSRLFLLDGQITCITTNPMSGKSEMITLHAGQMLTGTTDENGNISLVADRFTEAEVEGFVAAAVKADRLLQQKIAAGGIFDVSLIIGQAEERLRDDQLLAGQALADAAALIAGQNQGQVVTEVFKDDNTDANGNSGSGGSGSGTAPGVTGRQMVQRTMPIRAAELNTLLQSSDVTLAAQSMADILDIDSGVTVPAGGILNIGSGVAVEVSGGNTLQVDGSLTMEESMTNRGTVNNTSLNTLQIKGDFNNSGTFTNTGRLIVAGDLTNTGGLTINGGTVENGIVLRDGSRLVLNGGTVYRGSAQAAVLYDQGGNGPYVELRGGTVDGGDGAAISVDQGTLEYYDTVIKAKDISNLLRGINPKFIYFDAENGGLVEGNLEFTPICTEEEGGYSMVGLSKSVRGALSMVRSGQVIVMRADGAVAEDALVQTGLGDSAILDLNGFTLTLEENPASGTGSAIYSGTEAGTGALTIRDSKTSGRIVVNDGGFYISEGGELTLDGFEMEISDTSSIRTFQNFGGQFTVQDMEIRSDFGGNEPVMHLTGGNTMISNSTVVGNSLLPAGAVISASAHAGSGTVQLDCAKIIRQGSGPAIDIQQQTDLTIGDGTEIIGTVERPDEGVLYLHDASPVVSFNGGNIRNEADGYVILWDSAEYLFPEPDGLGTKIEGMGRNLLGAGGADLLPEGYVVKQNESSGYYELAADATDVALLSLEQMIEEEFEEATPSDAEISDTEPSDTEPSDEKQADEDSSTATSSNANPSGQLPEGRKASSSSPPFLPEADRTKQEQKQGGRQEGGKGDEME